MKASVDMRYDEEFWPTPEEVAQELARADTINRFVVERLPSGLSHPPPTPGTALPTQDEKKD